MGIQISYGHWKGSWSVIFGMHSDASGCQPPDIPLLLVTQVEQMEKGKQVKLSNINVNF